MYIAGTAVQGVGVLLVVPLITRVLGPEEYGRVAVALVIVQMSAVALAAGLPQVILREHFGDGGRDHARALAGMMVALGSGIASLAVVVALIGASGLRPVGPRWPLAIATAAGLSALIGCQALFRAEFRPAAFLVSALTASLGAQAVGLAAALTEPTATAFLSGYCAAVLCAAAIAALAARPAPPWREWSRVLSTLRMSLPLLPHGLAMMGLLVADTAVVASMLGPTEAGRYQLALVVGTLPIVFINAITNAWSPRVFSEGPETRWQYLGRTGIRVSGLVAVVAVGVAVASPALLHVFGGDAYDSEQLVGAAATLAFAGMPTVAYLTSSFVLFQNGRITGIAAYAMVGLGVLTVGSLILLPSVGLIGAAVGKAAGYAVLAVLTTVSATKVAGHFVRTPRTLLAAAAVGCAAGGLLGTDAPGWVLRAAVFLIAAVAVTGIVGADPVASGRNHRQQPGAAP